MKKSELYERLINSPAIDNLDIRGRVINNWVKTITKGQEKERNIDIPLLYDGVDTDKLDAALVKNAIGMGDPRANAEVISNLTKRMRENAAGIGLTSEEIGKIVDNSVNELTKSFKSEARIMARQDKAAKDSGYFR
jgi:hypothetical protein